MEMPDKNMAGKTIISACVLTVVNFRRKVFALIISENDGVFDTTIYALPESMKVSG